MDQFVGRRTKDCNSRFEAVARNENHWIYGWSRQSPRSRTQTEVEAVEMNWYKRASGDILLDHTNHVFWETNETFTADGTLKNEDPPVGKEKGIYDIFIDPVASFIELDLWTSIEYHSISMNLRLPWGEEVNLNAVPLGKQRSGNFKFSGSGSIQPRLLTETRNSLIDVTPGSEVEIHGYMDDPDNPPAVELRRKWKPWK